MDRIPVQLKSDGCPKCVGIRITDRVNTMTMRVPNELDFPRLVFPTVKTGAPPTAELRGLQQNIAVQAGCPRLI
jgi:hypothetical protein